jgi:cell division septation protein DedD
MNPLLDEDDDDLNRTNRELTLSTGMILGIFLVLVLLCGAFFGFGYKMGSHKATLPVAATNAEGPQPTGDTFSGFKPAAGSPAGESGESSAAPAPAVNAAGDSGEAPGGAAAAESASPVAPAHTPVPVVTTPETPVAAGNFIVQVAAVSHEEDAQLLVNALRAKGYPVSAHTEPQDKFFHIQVGPFNNAKDAAAAKQRLVADGYQPIVK